MQALSAVQLWHGDTDAALASIELALELNPLASHWASLTHGAVLWALERPLEALRALDACRVEQPHSWAVQWVRVLALFECGRVDEARATAAGLLSAQPLLTTSHLLARWSDAAAALRKRVRRAAAAVGIPMRPAPQSGL